MALILSWNHLDDRYFLVFANHKRCRTGSCWVKIMCIFMCTEFIQALLLLLLFTCYHLFCQEHPKGFMLWPFAYCSFSHEWWSINKHQGVWKCARRGKRISTHTKKFQSFGSEIYTPTDNICFMSKFNSSHYIYFYSYFSHSLSLSLSL